MYGVLEVLNLLVGVGPVIMRSEWRTCDPCRTPFDVAFTFEERVMEQLVEGACCLLFSSFMHMTGTMYPYWKLQQALAP